jgi:hypothetical protein
VLYAADPVNGFNAVVQRSPLVHAKAVKAFWWCAVIFIACRI